MNSMIQRIAAGLTAGLRTHPDRALWCFGFLCTLLILPLTPNLAVSDSVSRFRDAHWLWSGEDPGGPLPGIGGLHHHWYGAGQGLLFILPDWVLTRVGVDDLTHRAIITFYILFPTLNGLVLSIAWHAARELGFDSREASGGVLVLTGCTTLLWHFQNNQENPFMLGLAFLAVVGLLRWDRSGSRLWLHLACAAQAWNVLIRLPNLALVLPIFGLPFLTRLLAGGSMTPRGEILRSVLGVMKAAVPWMVLAAFLDRGWHRIRFGHWTGTYMGEFGNWARANFVGVAPDFPFSGELLPGVLQFFTSPAKSLFLYEPLIVVLIIAWVLGRSSGRPALAALLIAATASTCGTILGLARCDYWSGEPSWGPRFLATPAHLLQLPAAIWMFRAAVSKGSALRIPSMAILVLLCGIQVAGIWLPAYHETIVHRLQVGEETSPDPGKSSLPILGSTGDWRVVERPRTVFAEIVHQIRDPEGWASSRPPQRLLVPFRPLSQLSKQARWSIRAGWACGLLLLATLAIAMTRRDLESQSVSGLAGSGKTKVHF